MPKPKPAPEPAPKSVAGFAGKAAPKRAVKPATKADPLARQGYHHGNLKEALVATARQLIAERGPAGFTLAEAARLAGVSAAAPYRHFKDREALIAEVARRGFQAFGQRLRAAWAGAGSHPVAAFGRMGEAYLAFAREEPGYYGAMFTHGRNHGEAPGTAGGAAFAALEDALGKAVGADARSAGARQLAYQVWALAHGVATLAAGRLLPEDDPALSPGRLLADAVPALLARISQDAEVKGGVTTKRRGGVA
ncbi:MAG: TetR/AcrR family transcriptional regulator [Variibacter sp.]|nr:TetR/AcrR family transcriptional regulator [Variibacter sp.]